MREEKIAGEFPRASNDLGIEHCEHKNYITAVQCFQQAAKHDYADAQHNLAVMYYHGYGTEQNYDEALLWVKKAEAQGYEKAIGLVEAIRKMLHS